MEVGEVEVGVVGTRAFAGCSGSRDPDFGELLVRQIYEETSVEVDALECGSRSWQAATSGSYAAIVDTIVGKPEAIWAFLGSARSAG